MGDIDTAAKAIAGILSPETGPEENQEQVVTEEVEQVETLEEAPEADASGEADPVEQEIEPETGLEAPATMNDAEKVAFESAPREVQEWSLRLHQSQQSTLTKKSQEIAEVRKAAEAEKAALAQQRQELEQALTSRQEKPPHSDEQLAELKATDEVAWTVAATENAQFERNQAVLKAEADKLRQARLEEFAAQQAEAITKAHAKLPELITEWADEAVATKEKTEVASYLSSWGYSDDVISGIADPVAITLANKARKWDALQKSKKKALDKVNKAPPMGKPGTPEGKVADDALKKAQDKAKKTGKVDDVGDMLAVRFASRT